MSSEEARLKLDNEQLREEVHKLTLKLENVRKTHATELEYIKEEHELEKRDLRVRIGKNQEEYKAREALKDDKHAALTEELNSLREELDTCLQSCEKFRNQVEILRNAKTAGAASSYSDYEGLKECQRTLKAQLSEKEEILTAQVDKISKLDREVGVLKRIVTEMGEVNEGKDSAIKDLGARIKELETEKEEDNMVHQNEILTLKDEIKRLTGANSNEDGRVSAGSGSTRGNSLFSEVEERRLKVEGELKRLRDLVKRLTAENRTLQFELERGDTHSATITTQLDVILKSEHELKQDIRKDKSETLNLFDSYRDRLEYLRGEYTRKLQQYKIGLSVDPTSYELETLRQDRDTLQLIKLSLERENNEVKRELKYNKHLRYTSESNVKILKAKIEYIKLGGSASSAIDNNNATPTPPPQTTTHDDDGYALTRPLENSPSPTIPTATMKEEAGYTPSTPLLRSKLVSKVETQDNCNQQ